jgi:hypothetical protein
MDVLRWALSVPLAAVGALFLLGNVAAIVLPLMRRWKGSLVPVLGGPCLAVSMLNCPRAGIARFAWLPLVIDPGCGLLLTGVAVSLICSFWQR